MKMRVEPILLADITLFNYMHIYANLLLFIRFVAEPGFRHSEGALFAKFGGNVRGKFPGEKCSGSPFFKLWGHRNDTQQIRWPLLPDSTMHGIRLSQLA